MTAATALRRSARVVLLAVATLACDTNPDDPTQRPVVTVTQTQMTAPVIAWQPDGAQLVRVYRGSSAGDGYDANLVWSIAATSRNSLRSGVAYGAVPSGGMTDSPARPLAAGEAYTVQVTRADPKGTGDGFTNTSNRYVGTATFTVASP